jgi:hypothetical protein
LPPDGSELRDASRMARGKWISDLGSCVCLPMAPVLPLKGSGDFGTSPVFGQLLGEPQPACAS